MLPAPITHEWTIDGERYRLIEWTRGGERRIRAEYAIAIAAAPAVIESMDGADLYAEAVARECLKEAPEIFWETRPAPPQANGTPVRVVTFEAVPRALWAEFMKGVSTFLGAIFPVQAPEPPRLADPGPPEPEPVAAPEAVPARPRMRAG